MAILKALALAVRESYLSMCECVPAHSIGLTFCPHFAMDPR